MKNSRKFIIEVWPHARTITVYPDKIVLPRKIVDQEVKYKASPQMVSIVGMILSLAFSLSFIPILGSLTIFFFLGMLLAIREIDKRLKLKQVEYLKTLLPRERVIRVVKKAVNTCKWESADITRFEDNDIVFEVRCGYPVKCAEYDRKSLTKFSTVYATILTILVISFFFLPPYVLLIVSIVSLGIVVSTYKFKVCKKYVIKKINVEINTG